MKDLYDPTQNIARWKWIDSQYLKLKAPIYSICMNWSSPYCIVLDFPFQRLTINAYDEDVQMGRAAEAKVYRVNAQSKLQCESPSAAASTAIAEGCGCYSGPGYKNRK